VQVSTLRDMQAYISNELLETGVSIDILQAAAKRGPKWRQYDLGPDLVDRDFVPQIVPDDVFPGLRLAGIEFDRLGNRVDYTFWNVGVIVGEEAVAFAPGVPQRAADVMCDAALFLQEQQLTGILPDLSPDLLSIRRLSLPAIETGL
jgi:hypothetical protein